MQKWEERRLAGGWRADSFTPHLWHRSAAVTQVLWILTEETLFKLMKQSS